MARSVRLVLGLALLTMTWSLAGCADEVNLTNSGVACLSPDEEWPEDYPVFVENENLWAIVHLDDCLSSSCTSDRHASCTIVREGDQLIIESTGGYLDESGPGDSCTSNCLVLEATCELAEPLESGTYTVTYGDAEIELTIPGMAGLYCVSMD